MAKCSPGIFIPGSIGKPGSGGMPGMPGGIGIGGMPGMPGIGGMGIGGMPGPPKPIAWRPICIPICLGSRILPVLP